LNAQVISWEIGKKAVIKKDTGGTQECGPENKSQAKNGVEVEVLPLLPIIKKGGVKRGERGVFLVSKLCKE